MDKRTPQVARSLQFGNQVPPAFHVVDSKKEKNTLIKGIFVFVLATTTFVSLSKFSKVIPGNPNFETVKQDEVHAVGIPGMGTQPGALDVPKAIQSIRAENIQDQQKVDPFLPEMPKETHMPALPIKQVKANIKSKANVRFVSKAKKSKKIPSEVLRIKEQPKAVVEVPVPVKTYNEADTMLHIHQGLVDRFDYLASLDTAEKLNRAVAGLRDLERTPVEAPKPKVLGKVVSKVRPVAQQKQVNLVLADQIKNQNLESRNRFDNTSRRTTSGTEDQSSFEERFAKLWNESEYPGVNSKTHEYSLRSSGQLIDGSQSKQVAVANISSNLSSNNESSLQDSEEVRTNHSELNGSSVRITKTATVPSHDKDTKDSSGSSGRRHQAPRTDVLSKTDAEYPKDRTSRRSPASRTARTATGLEDDRMASHEYSKLNPIRFVVAFDVSSQVPAVETNVGSDLNRQNQDDAAGSFAGSFGRWVQASAQGYLSTLHYQSGSNEYRTNVEMLSENTLQLPLIPALEEGKSIVEIKIPGDAKVHLLGSSSKAIYFTDDKKVFKDDEWMVTRESKRVIFSNVDVGTATAVVDFDKGKQDHADQSQTTALSNTSGSVTFPTSANTSTFLDLSKYGRFRVAGTVFDASAMSLKSNPAVQVGFLHDLSSRKISDAKGSFEFDRVPVFADYPMILEATSREGLRFRFQVEASQIRTSPISLFTFSNEYVQSLINQLEGGISWDKSLVIGAIPVQSSLFDKNEKGEGINPEDLFPEIDSFESTLKAKSTSESDASGGEAYSLSPQGYLLTESALRSESPRFAFVEVARGPNVAKLVSKDRKTVWSNLLYNEKQTISVIIGN